jgi:hypothetical protein
MCNIHANMRGVRLWEMSKRMSGNLPQAGRIAS